MPTSCGRVSRTIPDVWSLGAFADSGPSDEPFIGVKVSSRASDVCARDVGDRLRAAVAHRQFEFALQDFEHAIDASLAERTESPEEGTSDAHGLGAERQRLEHVGASTDAAIHEHRHPSADFRDHLGECFDGRTTRFGRPSAVIGHLQVEKLRVRISRGSSPVPNNSRAQQRRHSRRGFIPEQPEQAGAGGVLHIDFAQRRANRELPTEQVLDSFAAPFASCIRGCRSCRQVGLGCVL